MAQISIREYDAKNMFYESIWESFTALQVHTLSDIEKLDTTKRYVIKPDMLFGKRGKRGLLWVNLNKQECTWWLKEKFQTPCNIDGVIWTLDYFLVEDFVPIEQEYYVSFCQSKTGDTIIFSETWGVDVEENWDKTRSITLGFSEDLTDADYTSLWITNNDVWKIVLQLWKYYKNYGFVYLEINPLARDTNGKLHIIDMVAKVDDCEAFRQRKHWKNIEIPQEFGFQENEGEKYIRELDATTGASLKFKILNPDARIWTLLAGWWGSLVMTDTLWHLWYANELWNYGELSGNPTREFTKEYTKVLIREMLRNEKKDKYLIIAWAIANFTHVDKTFLVIIDVLEEYQTQLQEQNVQILVRRGGINEKKWLTLLEQACNRLNIPAIITGSESYMTHILQHIKL